MSQASVMAANPTAGMTRAVFPIRHYDLDATLTSGQAFRWHRSDNGWTSIIGSRWVRVDADGSYLTAQTGEPVFDWGWLTHYLQCDVDLETILCTFPKDGPMLEAIAACRGLRLLRQDPWECLISFILSSTKQIVQIRQIVALLCERFGDPVVSPPNEPEARSFPCPARLAEVTEAELRSCKMGFRAPYVRATAQAVATGELDLVELSQLPVISARERLMELPGVGRKIADCVLLFAYGFQSAFPVDVWVMRALRQLYFPRRRVTLQQLHRFSAKHFGPYGGYAQQYLFHYARTKPADRAS